MSLADTARATGKAIRTLGLAAALSFAPAAMAAPAAAPTPAATAAAAPAADAAKASPATADAGGYVPMKPTPGKGQPVDGRMTFQDQYSPTGKQALAMHDYVLFPIIVAITFLVLVLLLVVMARFNRRANPVASKTSHNTLIEVIWTLVPVLILVVIAVPSIRLLAQQYKPAPKGALTVKVTGYQWYWGYTYPDNGGFEVISNMLPDEEAIKRGEPPQLAADARMVVPVGEPIRLQTTGADVIHSFAVPSLWFKLDAVPGRINEKVLIVNEPGVYYGQCSELCGVRHGYMPIVVEALPRPKFEAWVKAQGGTVGAAAAAPAAAAPAAAPAAATPAAAAVPAAPAADASAAPAA
ncbi:cytochrome c oxidase subunit II [Novosphingobium sp. KCTC 2891]|uniref:cytochrome c oxidase subunit II n=1 Tax=Novosphingobium sp. KCTC 2891 TaxID=2989730 RepID=UPI0022235562|nr:cytochrome c oxidase subunit II [Novosphingobium sp. KCTC 2891]MCW1382566.1 cytochrome c oxidase subunit II [Novosphingobium sp. KCTC 2891]